MIAVKLQYFCIIFIVVTNSSHGCKPLSYNTDSVDLVAKLTERLKILQKTIPQYNDTNVPNAQELLSEFLNATNNEDKYLNFTQLVTKYGYPVEEHEVETSDGYLLTMFRIANVSGPPVLLLHGILCSSDDYIINGPWSSLAYLLADAGYDVWLGNSRGNKYSRRHVSISPNCGEFWDFSFDEIGRYDIPAMIDKILNATGHEQLIYIGHSQGNVAFFVMCSEKPEYNPKIALMVALSVNLFFYGTRNPFLQFLLLLPEPDTVLSNAIGLYEFLPSKSLSSIAIELFCGTPATATLVCHSVMFLIFGFDYEQANGTNLPVVYAHFPSGTSTKTLIHFAQSTDLRKFCQYDYKSMNLQRYGTLTPPEYSPQRATCPVAIFYSLNDWATGSGVTERLLRLLPNVVEFYQVPFERFNHLDYIWGKNVKQLVNNEVISLLNKYRQF